MGIAVLDHLSKWPKACAAVLTAWLHFAKGTFTIGVFVVSESKPRNWGKHQGRKYESRERRPKDYTI